MKNDFENGFFRLSSNPVFGKNMKNVRRQSQLEKENKNAQACLSRFISSWPF